MFARRMTAALAGAGGAAVLLAHGDHMAFSQPPQSEQQKSLAAMMPKNAVGIIWVRRMGHLPAAALTYALPFV